MLNPLGKVQSLKIQIDQIKEQIFASVPENASSPSKLNEKDALISKLTNLKNSTVLKKEEIVAQIQAAQKKLQSLSQKKQSTNKSKALRSKYQNQVSIYEKELAKVNLEYQLFAENYDRMYGVSIDPALFESNINPIENQLRQVVDKHSNLTETLKNLEQEQLRMENTLKMIVEDIISQSAAKAESIMERENLETQMELIEYEFAEELEYNEQEDDFIIKMLKLKKLKDPVLSQYKDLKNSVENIELQVEKTKAKISNCSAELVRMCLASPGFEELKNVEELVKEKSKVFKTDNVEKVIVDVNSFEGFDIDEEILKAQISAVDKQELQLREMFKAEANELKTWIAHLESRKMLTDEVQRKFRLRERSFNLKVAAIKSWKSVAATLVSTSDNLGKIVQDSAVVQEFKSQFSSITYKEHKKLENLMSAYLSLLDKREKFYSEFPLQRKISEKSSLESEIISLVNQKPSVLKDQFQVESQISDFEKEEKKLSDNIKSLGIVPNSSKAQFYMLKDKIQTWDENFKSSGVSPSQEIFFEYKKSLELVKADTYSLRTSLASVTDQEFTLSSEVEKILELKRAEMLNSLQDLKKNCKNPEEMQMYELNFRVVEASTKVERATKDLKDFDSNILGIISSIEQEEISLRKQQIELEQDMKEVEKELGFIVDYEQKLKKLDHWDLASALTIDNCRSPFEEYLGSGFKGGDDGPVIEGKYLEFAEKLLGRAAQVPRNRMVNRKYYRIRLENTSQADRNFYEKIMPLLEGAELYKKLSEKSRKFDPMAEALPESCGYNLRQIHLHMSLEKIEMKHPMKPGFDLRILTEQLGNPKVSKVTLALLQSQGHEELDFTDGDQVPVYLPKPQQVRTNVFYPFTIVLSTREQIEVIAKDYITFKQWIQGINALVLNKKKLVKLRTRIETYTSV